MPNVSLIEPPERCKGGKKWYAACRVGRKTVKPGDVVSVGSPARLGELVELWSDKKGAGMKVRPFMDSEAAEELSPGISVCDRELFDTTREPVSEALEDCNGKLEVKFVSFEEPVDVVVAKLGVGAYLCRQKYDRDSRSFTFLLTPASSKKKKQVCSGPPDLDQLFEEAAMDEKKRERDEAEAEKKFERCMAEHGLTTAFEDVFQQPDSSECSLGASLCAEPGPPGQPVVTKVTASSVELNWEAAAANGHQVHRYSVERKQGSGEWGHPKTCKGTGMSLSGLDLAGQEYVFRVQAQNKLGMGDFSAPSEPTTTTAPAHRAQKDGAQPAAKRAKKEPSSLLHVPLKLKCVASSTWRAAVVTCVDGSLCDISLEGGEHRRGVRLAAEVFEPIPGPEMLGKAISLYDSKKQAWVDADVTEERPEHKFALQGAAWGKRLRVFRLEDERWQFQ